jgi:nucleotide-binding universal stress UspA family protein
MVKEVTSLSNMLVCTDGSDHAVKALRYAINLAQKMGGNITLLNVQDHRIRKVSPKTAEDLGNRIISKSLEAIKEEKPEIDRKIEFGVPSNVIVEVAEKGKHDLIVLGSKGLGIIPRFLLGSVSDDVAHKAKCSVLIVR